MKKLTKKDFDYLLLGSSFFGTGGGGNPKEAKQMFQNIVLSKKTVNLKSISQFKKNELFITAYGVGPITTSSNPEKLINKGVKVLKKLLKRKIAGIIPVEIGPKSVAIACQTASNLNLPILDADFVGGRSSPEIFLETITLFGISRKPSVIINNNGDLAILYASRSPKFEESFFRDFSNISGERAWVVGYPITQEVAKKSIALETISQAQNIGKLLTKNKISAIIQKTQGKLLFEGKIKKIKSTKTKGFTTISLFLSDKNNSAKIFIKNENLVFWIDNKVKLTCPDLIILLDKNNRPIYNLYLKEELPVKVIGLPANKLWRTKKGLKLFNPKIFSFEFSNKLIN